MGAKTAAEIMTPHVRTIPAEATLRDAAMLLSAHNISGAPVVDADGKMLGIVSESDLLSEKRREAALPRIAAFGVFVVPEETMKRAYHEGASLPVTEVMTKNVLAVVPETTLPELAQLMIGRKVNRVPVVDSENNLVGIVTREDLLRGLYDLAP